MFHVKQHKQIRDTNRLIDNAKHKRIKQYYEELSNYIDDVTKLSLDKIVHDANTEDGETSCDGKLSDELGSKLLNPPKLGDLSLPGFLVEEKIDDKNKSVLSSLEKNNEEKRDFEVIDLNKGYLYIY